jgi:hypothetical protein
MLKSSIKKILPQPLKDLVVAWQDYRELKQWERDGKPAPPPHLIKQLKIKEYQEKSGVTTLVETGTYLGKMIDAQRNRFRDIYSVELSEPLYKAAKEKFAPYPHITILQGDSGKVLHSLVPQLRDRAIFWLDGHYSAGITAKGEKECPIYDELDAIFKSKYEHILLIDDARCFVGQNDYPTIEELSEYIRSKNKKYKVQVEDDVIVATSA